MSTAVIASSDTPPILEFTEHILDFMPLFIKLAIELDGLVVDNYHLLKKRSKL